MYDRHLSYIKKIPQKSIEGRRGEQRAGERREERSAHEGREARESRRERRREKRRQLKHMGYGCLPCLLDSRAIELLLTKYVCLELMVSWDAQ
jgi:hypothetical protein